jgi:hypothetical protein
MSDAVRIFLSHRSADKAVVREYKRTLELLGLDPWIDEDDLTAGAELERGIQNGMKDSCAVVFFVTPAFLDERWLRAELNYAIAEKRTRDDSFALITLVLPDADGKVGVVPPLLEPYVFKRPSNHLEGLREIIRALPPSVGAIEWRRAGGGAPDVRVKVASGHLVSPGSGLPAVDVLMVTAENHGLAPVYLSGGLCMRTTDPKNNLWVGKDADGRWLYPVTVNGGDSVTISVGASDLLKFKGSIRQVMFTDKIGREFEATEEETKRALAGLWS